MNMLRILRVQHDAISAMLLELHNQLVDYRGPADAPDIVLGLSRLLKLLRSHLALEDEWLYPAMIGSNEPAAAVMAGSFARSMGGLACDLEEFHRRWAVSAAVAGAFPQFRAEAFAMLRTVDRRIDREDAQLFPAAERIRLASTDTAA